MVRTLGAGRSGAGRIGRWAGAVAIGALVLTGCADASGLSVADDEPTSEVTEEPTEEPTEDPTEEPTEEPTDEPTDEPTEPPVQVERPQAGDCVKLTSTDVFYDVLREVPASTACSARHSAQVTDVSPLTPPLRKAVRTGNVDPVTSRLVNGCRTSAEKWLGTDTEGFVISQFGSLPALPSFEELEAGADWYVCSTYVLKRGTKLLPLEQDTRRILAGKRAADFGTCARAAITNAGNDRLVCTIKHNWRAVAAVRLGGPGAKYPGDNSARDRVQGSCEGKVGDWLNATGTYNYGYTWPTRQLWEAGDRYGVCYAKVHS
jgi:hypothetical protein